MENAKDIKEWCEEQWRGALIHSGHGNVFVQGPGGIHTKAGSNRTYKSKEQKTYEARFGIYNKKLVPIILAEATSEPRPMEIEVQGKTWRDPTTFKTVDMPHYTWPKQDKPQPVAVIPRKRVPKAKLEQAAAIIAKVPQDELTAFLARFGLSLSLAASIASLGDVEMIARQFLRATL